jgi:hypothetical protein
MTFSFANDISSFDCRYRSAFNIVACCGLSHLFVVYLYHYRIAIRENNLITWLPNNKGLLENI